MIVTLKKNASEKKIKQLREHIRDKGFEIHDSIGSSVHIFGVIGDTASFDIRNLYAFDCVEKVIRVQEPYKKVNRKFNQQDTVVDVKGVKIGGDNLTIMAGPCSVESEEQLDIIANHVKKAGAKILRGGAFKPRTSPYSFQGMGEEGLILLAKVGKKYDMPIVSEIMDKDHIELFKQYVDIFQVGARNMQNFALLKELGKTKRPVLLKRGFSNTIEEWFMSAEYIMSEGNNDVILCERGIRTFEPLTRNTLDISSIPIVKKMSHLPVIIDPSHAAGVWDLVESLSMGSIAAGADGLIIEVHHNPEEAFSDGAQSLKPKKFAALMKKINPIANVVNKKM